MMRVMMAFYEGRSQFGERAVHRGRSLVRFDFLVRFRNDTKAMVSDLTDLIRVVNNKRTQLTVAAILSISEYVFRISFKVESTSRMSNCTRL